MVVNTPTTQQQNSLKRYLRPALGLLGLAIVLLPLGVQALLFGDDEPLAPELAFVPQIESVTDEAISVSFEITDSYYLYRDKTSFTAKDVQSGQVSDSGSGTIGDNSSSPAVSLDLPTFGDAQIIEDDFFGAQAIFRDSTLISIPYTAGAQAEGFALAVKFQGCADIGLCYPPTTVMLDVDLPPREEPTQAANQAAKLSNLVNSPSSPSLTGNTETNTADPLATLLGGDANEPELLPPELAFLPQITHASTQAIAVNWHIEEGYYLYRDKLKLSLEHAGNTESGRTLVSVGQDQYDDFFGNVMVLRHRASSVLQAGELSNAGFDTSALKNAQLKIEYQGCADIGVCFPPAVASLPVSLSNADGATLDIDLAALINVSDSGSGGSAAKPTRKPVSHELTEHNAMAQAASQPSNPPLQSEQDRLSSLLGSSSIWLTIATFFGLGLLLAFTPCVLPMIPILSSLIVGQGQSMSTARAFQLSVVYVLVMASTYAVVGVLVGLSGYNVQAFLQNPIVLSAIAALFVALSLSMFGFYELQMPTAIQNRLTQWSNRQGGGQVGGVAAMGFISTLIVGPCVTAPLAGALIYIAKTGDAVMGGAALFALGLGMGAPLLLIGTSAGRLVPKAGAWMNVTKHIFGILMLGMAVYMISRFIDPTITVALYGVLAMMSAVYLGATDTISDQSSGWQRFGKGAGMVVGVYGLALLVGALAGGQSYIKPLSALTPNNSVGSVPGSEHAGDHSLPFEPIKSVANLESAVASASALGRPVMLDFYADWCISCKEMDAFTFSDPRVQELLSTALVVQADVTANDAEDQALLKAFDLFGPPGVVFYNAQGQELKAARVVGFMNAEDFADHVERFLFASDT